MLFDEEMAQIASATDGVLQSESNEAPKAKNLNPIQKLASKPNSKNYAIRAMCFQCMGGIDADPGWRRAIGDCKSVGCALHGHRPYRVKP